jgi:hypothetical protein
MSASEQTTVADYLRLAEHTRNQSIRDRWLRLADETFMAGGDDSVTGQISTIRNQVWDHARDPMYSSVAPAEDTAPEAALPTTPQAPPRTGLISRLCRRITGRRP